ncbi:MAG: sugar phosphate isomerase/epimerase [Verrucomicrobiales bacterium]|nr:sugar phosphate isomerase/epimerase [Verrucomicrobiales bacterium]
MLSFSTCWNSHRHSEGETLVQEVLGLGFDTLEISHGLKISLLPGLKKMIGQGAIRVSGVHNFCPSPVEVMIDAPDAYEFTSHRPHERERALSLTLKTIEFAAEVGARYVVLHLGSVPMKRWSRELQEMAAAGELNSRKFVRLKLKMIRHREALGAFYVKRAREALAKIAEHAEKFQVPVGIESRSGYEQVPTEREMAELMQEFASPWVGYWHDFGHVQLKHNIELLDHFEWLTRMQPYLLGCHFHDVVWPDRDHRVPFQGDVDFDQLMPLVPVGRPIVWEMSPRRKSTDIRAALPVWKKKFAAWL